MIPDIRSALRQFLLDDPAVSASVGGSRIHPISMPQGVKFTSIVINRISGSVDYHMGGPSGLANVFMQVDVWATAPMAANSLANLVLERLSGHSGTITFGSGSPSEQIVVQGIFFQTEREDYDDVSELYRVSRDYNIWYEQS